MLLTIFLALIALAYISIFHFHFDKRIVIISSLILFFLIVQIYLIRSRGKWKRNIRTYVAQHPELNEDIRRGLTSLTLVPGMDSKQVQLIMGAPDSISPDPDEENREQWIYKTNKHTHQSENVTVVLENDKVEKLL